MCVPDDPLLRKATTSQSHSKLDHLEKIAEEMSKKLTIWNHNLNKIVLHRFVFSDEVTISQRCKMLGNVINVVNRAIYNVGAI